MAKEIWSKYGYCTPAEIQMDARLDKWLEKEKEKRKREGPKQHVNH